MKQNVSQKLIESHLVDGEPVPGNEIGIRIDQTLTQDATGTLVMLALEALGLDRVRTELSAQYVDHNLLQEDNKNPDDHLFLLSAARRFGLWFSYPGNGVSHVVHQENFGAPGKTLLGSDSHTCAAGAIGMLAIGAGGMEVTQVMAGRPYYVRMPKIWGIELVGKLPDWVSAKDVILEMLRRHGVKGAVGCVLEYHGPGLACLSAMDRHVIANMGTELGATTSVFPSDDAVRHFLKCHGREKDWKKLVADDGATYDRTEKIDLSTLEPLIAMPSSPGNVRPVREVAGEEIYQAYIGSSANPGFSDFAVVAEILRGRSPAPGISLDVNPTSRRVLQELVDEGYLGMLVRAGARIHQSGCNGCIGMGQAPATDGISLRTVPRNFPGRSGTKEDKVCLVSPETAAASAITGRITDPRELHIPYHRPREPESDRDAVQLLSAPLPPEEAERVKLRKGPNIASLPALEALPTDLDVTVLLNVGDNISTDEILPAGARVLPFRSNIEQISQFAFEAIDGTYVRRAHDLDGDHAVIGGENYGQGSSREHAALAPRSLGLRVVIAKSFARIHAANLVNFGVLPLTFVGPAGGQLKQGERLHIDDVASQLRHGDTVTVRRVDKNEEFETHHQLSDRQIEILTEGGLLNWLRARIGQEAATVGV